MQIARMAWLLAALALLAFRAHAQDIPAPKDAYLYIISPQDGAVIKGSFLCRFGLRNMRVVRSGTNAPASGRHHLLVDVDAPLDPKEPIPLDKRHIHFGEGCCPRRQAHRKHLHPRTRCCISSRQSTARASGGRSTSALV